LPFVDRFAQQLAGPPALAQNLGGVIIDFHTHVFPPAMIADRDSLVRRDAGFAEMYGDPAAKMATAPDLLAAMGSAGVDVSVALGFAWADPEDCRRHNDYLLEAAAGAGGRIVPFCTVQPAAGQAAFAEAARCAAAGARGVGELRPAGQGYRLDGSAEEAQLVRIARELGLVLLFHVSEPVGHSYPGKRGLPLEDFASFAARNPGLPIVGAHWGGGLPFFAAMPEVRRLLDSVWVDTAATSLLYAPGVYRSVATLRPDRVLFGSDYPLLSQKRARHEIEGAGLAPEVEAAVLGENGARLLGLS
jgi:predicted TIM-barrel fold metal-dependent hydrolase